MSLLNSVLGRILQARGSSPRARIVVSHYHDASYWRPDAELFLHIQAGRARSGVRLDMPGDDTGDHISGKNDSYGELTAMYWAWKNLGALDIIGFCHYRRYFVLDRRYPENLSLERAEQEYLEPALTDPAPLRKLGEADVIVTKPRRFEQTTLEAQFKLQHRAEDFDAMVETVVARFPDYAATREAFASAKRLYCCNMFIARRGFVERYMQWLFAVLTDLEARIAPPAHGYQRRTFAFLAERLLNWYLIQQQSAAGLRLHELGVAFLDEVAYRRTFVRY